MAKRVLIVGGVAGGASTAARLRRLDEKAIIILFERGPDVSFANCGLPYYLGGEIKDRSKLLVQTPQKLAANLNLDVRVRSEVIKINRDQKTITVQNLEKNSAYDEPYDVLILAPGQALLFPRFQGWTDLVFSPSEIWSTPTAFINGFHQIKPKMLWLLEADLSG